MMAAIQTAPRPEIYPGRRVIFCSAPRKKQCLRHLRGRSLPLAELNLQTRHGVGECHRLIEMYQPVEGRHPQDKDAYDADIGPPSAGARQPHEAEECMRMSVVGAGNAREEEAEQSGADSLQQIVGARIESGDHRQRACSYAGKHQPAEKYRGEPEEIAYFLRRKMKLRPRYFSRTTGFSDNCSLVP